MNKIFLGILTVLAACSCKDECPDCSLSGEEVFEPLEQGVTVTINNGDAFSNKKDVVLSFSQEYPELCVSEGNYCNSWFDATESVVWHFNGEGPQRVYVWGADGDSSEPVGPTSATIWIDTVPPVDGTVTVTPLAGGFNISWDGFHDAGSGIEKFKVLAEEGGVPMSCNDGRGVVSVYNVSAFHVDLPNGYYGYRVCSIDSAGNVSRGATATVGQPY